MVKSAPVGILALQGGYAQHGRMLDQLKVPWKLVKTPKQVDSVSGLIVPGGESSTFIKLLSPALIESIQTFHQQGKPLFGTCAGCILLAKTVQPSQFSFGLIDIVVSRNAYGRQIDSFVGKGRVNRDPLSESGRRSHFSKGFLDMVFIRAPKIVNTHSNVEILATHQNEPVLVQQGSVMVATFHPELTEDPSVHRFFIEKIQ